MERVKEYYGRALGIYTHLVTCPCTFGRKTIGSIGKQIKSEKVGSAGEDFCGRVINRLRIKSMMRISPLSQILTENKIDDEDLAVKSKFD